jgi:hypothetical protein
MKSGKNRVNIQSVDVNMVGNIFCPPDFDETKKYPAVLFGGPMATVKEQAPGFFAEELAKRGFITLAFDYTGFGESEGHPRYYEDPASKTEDIHNVVSFLASLPNVNKDAIGATGICASASYIAPAVVSDTRIKAFSTVVGHFSLREFFVDNPMLTDEQRSQMLNTSSDARQKHYESGETECNDMIWPDMTGQEEGEFFQEIYDYYFARVKECWPNFTNHLAVFSYGQLVKSHALDCAKFIDTPYLGIVGSEAITRPFTERFVEAKTAGESEIMVIEGASHIQTYDIPEYIESSVNALNLFFSKHLQ